MNRKQLLLCKLAEEASEISKIALKTQQFGFNEIKPDQGLTNAERIYQELDDLAAIVEMLKDEFGFGYSPNREAIDDKKYWVNHYAEYSVNLGEVGE